MTPPTPSEARQVALLLCPFCGGEAREYNFVIEACVECMTCRARIIRRHQSHADTGLPEAIAAWNRRALRQGGEAVACDVVDPAGGVIADRVDIAYADALLRKHEWADCKKANFLYAIPPPPAEGEAA